MSTDNHSKKDARDQREAHLAALSLLILRRVSDTDIAEKLGITLGQISRDRRILTKRWRAKSDADTETRIAEELRQIEQQEREAWQAWEESRTDPASDGVGDPRFQQVLINLRAQRMQLLGIAGNTNIMIDLSSQHATINVPPAAETHEEWLEQNVTMERVTGVGLHTVPPEYAELAEISEPIESGRHNGNSHQGSEEA